MCAASSLRHRPTAAVAAYGAAGDHKLQIEVVSDAAHRAETAPHHLQVSV